MEKYTRADHITGYTLFHWKIRDQFSLPNEIATFIADSLYNCCPEMYDFILAAREKKALQASQGWCSKSLNLPEFTDYTVNMILEQDPRTMSVSMAR